MDNQINSNLFEEIEHGTRDFPFVIYKRKFTKDLLSFISCHWHNELEIVYCNKGSISYTVNDKTYILNENNFIIVNSNCLHQAQMIGEASWYAILFDPKFIFGFYESKIKKEAFDNLFFNNLFIENDKLKKQVLDIINIYFKEEKFKSLLLHNKISTLYYDILIEASLDEGLKNTSSKTHSIRLKQILDYINLNYKNKITIDDICKEIGLCRSEVCKLFKSEVNTSISDYILKYRIEKSIPLLLSDKLNITQISEQCGFNSSSYYAEAFKKITNTTPLEYKKIFKKEQGN